MIINTENQTYITWVIGIIFFFGVAWSSVSHIKTLELAVTENTIRINILETKFNAIDKKLENIEKKVDRLISRR